MARRRRLAAHCNGLFLLPGRPKVWGERGTLSNEIPKEAKALQPFLSDPEKPVFNPYGSSGAYDYKSLTERNDVLTFDSEPMQRDTEVSGPIHAEIHLACDCRGWTRGSACSM